MSNMQHGGNRGDFRGRRGPFAQDSKTAYRFLIPSKAATVIIGPGGDRIKRLRTDYNSRLVILDSKGPERVFVVDGSLENCIKLWKDCFPDLKDVIGADPRKPGDEMDFRFLCHTSIVGTVIGKAGSKVKELRATHKLSLIKVHFELAPKSTDRVIQIIGLPDNILDCFRVILTDLESQTVRGPTENYSPENFDPHLCSAYGGWGLEFMSKPSMPYDQPPMMFEGGGHGEHYGSEMNRYGGGVNAGPPMNRYGGGRIEHRGEDRGGRPPPDHYGRTRNGGPHMNQYGASRNGVPQFGPIRNQYDGDVDQYDGEIDNGSSFHPFDGVKNAVPLMSFDSERKPTQYGSGRNSGGRNIVPLMGSLDDSYETPFEDCETRSAGMRRSYGDDRNNGANKKPRMWGSDNEADMAHSSYGSGMSEGVDMMIPSSCLEAVQGADGEKLFNIMNDSGAAIVVLPSDGVSSNRVLNVKGTKDQIEGAQYLMQMSMKRFMLQL